jgi:hypothetical protein
MLFRQNIICMGAALGSSTVGAAESVRAQLHSQGKLTMQRRENKKNRHENELLKAKELTPDV